MKIDILTLFPEMFDGFLNTSIIKRARDKKFVTINTVNIRDYSLDKHKKVDDTPYGGGSGMVLMCQPVFDAVKSVKKENSKVILMTPQGKKYDERMAEKLSKEEHLIFVCGHYEGFDERIRSICDEEISIGDYVLTGGELPSMVITDSVVRLIPGVIGSESHEKESFNDDMLDYPVYTKPRVYEGMEVPEVLVNGDHAKIEEYRNEEKIKRTNDRRPDLIKKHIIIRSKLKGSFEKNILTGPVMNPKNNAKNLDSITVKNLRIIDTGIEEALVKKNIDKKLQNLLVLMVKVLDTESDDDDFLVLDEADRIRSLVINKYTKVLGVEYKKSVLKKIDYIVHEFKKRAHVNEKIVEEKATRCR